MTASLLVTLIIATFSLISLKQIFMKVLNHYVKVSLLSLSYNFFPISEQGQKSREGVVTHNSNLVDLSSSSDSYTKRLKGRFLSMVQNRLVFGLLKL